MSPKNLINFCNREKSDIHSINEKSRNCHYGREKAQRSLEKIPETEVLKRKPAFVGFSFLII